MRYLIQFSYDGSKFHGFQRQNTVKSVQKSLEDALSKVLNTNIIVKGSGRTDAGVHALYQCAHFDYEKNLTKKDISKINNLLNREIIIKKYKKVNNDFHARHSAKKKIYLYKIITKNYKDKYDGYFYQIKYPLDITIMKKACKLFEGTHDFHNFVSGQRDNYKSHIYKIKITKRKDIIYIKFIAKGFYRYMVRHLAGALIDVGRGKTNFQEIKGMLDNPNINKKLSILPANGLYLVKVKY